MARSSSLFKRFGKQKISYQNLAKLNLVVAVLLGLQALAILILSDSGKGVVGITTNYLNSDTLLSSDSAQTVYVPATQHLFDLKLAYLLAVLLLAVGVSRWVAASFRRKRYEAGLRSGVNRHRWVEVGVLIALTMVSIGLISGILDLVTLVFIIWLSGLMSWLGYKFEQYSQKSKLTDMHLFVVGVKAIAMIWLAVLVYLAGALIWGRGLPTYIYFVYASLGLITAGFAYNTYRSFKKDGRWADKLWSERVYIVLALVGISALAWQVFAGTLR